MDYVHTHTPWLFGAIIMGFHLAYSITTFQRYVVLTWIKIMINAYYFYSKKKVE